MKSTTGTKSPKQQRVNFSLDYRIIIFVLLAVIAGMLIVWKPWEKAATTDRTVSVTGEATVQAEPDEFLFYPSYEFKNTDKDAALAELTKKSDEVVSKLKELGLANNKIKTNSSGNDYGYYLDNDKTTHYTLSLTVTATNKDQAQRVQDYLVTTQPLGSVSPQASFSDTMRKSLESKARDQATQDARNKADQSAHNLGFKITGVKTVQDGAGFDNGGIRPYEATLDSATARSATTLSVQPGENELNYSVQVTYFIR